MTNQHPFQITGQTDDYIVVCPRETDAVGRALRGVFDGPVSLPDDMTAAIKAIDRMTVPR